MKKILIISGILVLGVMLVSVVYANYYEKGYYGMCIKDPEVAGKFQKETLPLRDEMITKRLEIRKEYQKEKPDLDKIAQLKKDIIDLKTRIQKIANGMGINPGNCFKGSFGSPCRDYNRWQFGHKNRGNW